MRALRPQAMMDVDGNGSISEAELLSTAKSVMEAQKAMRSTANTRSSVAALPTVRALLFCPHRHARASTQASSQCRCV